MRLLRILGLVPAKAEPIPAPLPIDPRDGLYQPKPPVSGRTGPRLAY